MLFPLPLQQEHAEGWPRWPQLGHHARVRHTHSSSHMQSMRPTHASFPPHTVCHSDVDAAAVAADDAAADAGDGEDAADGEAKGDDAVAEEVNKSCMALSRYRKQVKDAHTLAMHASPLTAPADSGGVRGPDRGQRLGGPQEGRPRL